MSMNERNVFNLLKEGVRVTISFKARQWLGD